MHEKWPFIYLSYIDRGQSSGSVFFVRHWSVSLQAVLRIRFWSDPLREERIQLRNRPKIEKIPIFHYFSCDKKYNAPKNIILIFMCVLFRCAIQKCYKKYIYIWFWGVFFLWFVNNMILADYLLPVSGSGRPKWKRSIRIRIRNTDYMFQSWWCGFATILALVEIKTKKSSPSFL